LFDGVRQSGALDDGETGCRVTDRKLRIVAITYAVVTAIRHRKLWYLLKTLLE